MLPTDLVECPGARLRVAHGIFVSGEENISINAYAMTATNVITVAGRIRLCDGRVEPFRYDVVATNGRAVTTQIKVLGEGWLESLVAFVSSGSPSIGAAFVSVDLVRGLTGAVEVLDTLIAGYVTARGRRRWPGTPVADAFTSPGNLRSITGTDPAAGVEIAETVPTGARWRLRSLRATLVTSAAVANRGVSIRMDDGTNTYWGAESGGNQPASNTISYSAGEAAATKAGTVSEWNIAIPGALIMLAGHRFRTVTNNIDAGDNWGAPQYEVEEWLEGI